MIQVLTHSGGESDLSGNEIVVNSFHDASSLDEFEINIIDLSSQYLWYYAGNGTSSIDSIEDIKSLSVMINNSSNSKIIIMLPQNIPFTYHRYSGQYHNMRELKNMIGDMKEYVLSILYQHMERLDIVYENTITDISAKQLKASFYFNNITENIKTKSVKSNKVTTIGLEDVIISTLKLSNYEEIIAFLKAIGCIQDKQESPEWVKGVIMFDDEKQIDIIRENQTKIQEAESTIESARKRIEKNNEYKSILYTNGPELVKVVLEILEKILGCDFSGFEDTKNEDFLTMVEGYTFIGEIKGVNHNVNSENVAQLERHYQRYMDSDPEVDESKVYALLIINHQRKRPLSEREVVHERQISLAKKYGSLIIETYELLKLFEKYLAGERTREQCINILTKNKGLLSL